MVVATGDRRVDQHLDVGVRLTGGGQLSGLGPLGVVTPTEVSTQLGVVLDEQDRGAGVGTCEYRKQCVRSANLNF